MHHRQQLLCKRVSLHYLSVCGETDRVFEPSPYLATNIPILEISFVGYVDLIASDSQFFARVVVACPRLYELRIRQMGQFIQSFDAVTLSILASSPPPVKTLRLTAHR